jgi:hypothetical protein
MRHKPPAAGDGTPRAPGLRRQQFACSSLRNLRHTVIHEAIQMHSAHRLCVLAILLLFGTGCRSTRPEGERSGVTRGSLPVALDDRGALELVDAWWRAFTVGDTASLQRTTGADLAFVVSTGKKYDRDMMLRQAATHTGGPLPISPSDDATVSRPSPATIVVSSRVREGNNTFRYMTVLQATGSVWQIVAAQSTRVLPPPPRVTQAVSGPLTDFAGSYRGAQGRVVRVAVRDSVLELIPPNDADLRLEPIGPGLFEAIIPNTPGITMQFMFARDRSGQVTSLSRLHFGLVVTWPRIP